MEFTKKSDWENTLINPRFATELQRMDDAIQALYDNVGATQTVQLTTFSQLDEIIAANQGVEERTLYTFVVNEGADEGLQLLIGHTLLGVCESDTDITLTDSHTNIGYVYHNGTTSLSTVTPDKIQYIGSFYSASALLEGLQASTARYMIFDADGPFSLGGNNPYIAILSSDKMRYHITAVSFDRDFTTITLTISDASITKHSNPIVYTLSSDVCTSISEFHDMCIANSLPGSTMFYCRLSSSVHPSFSSSRRCVGFDVEYTTSAEGTELVCNIFNPVDGKIYTIDSAAGTCKCLSNLYGSYIDAGAFYTIQELREYPWEYGKLYRMFIGYPPNELGNIPDIPHGSVLATWDYSGSISNPEEEHITMYQNFNKYIYTIGDDHATPLSDNVHGCSSYYAANTVDSIFQEIGEKGAMATLTESQLYALDKMFQLAAYSSDEAYEAYEMFVDAFGIDKWLIMQNIDTARLKIDCQLSYSNNITIDFPDMTSTSRCDNIPYTYTPSTGRTSYPYFDLLIEPGYKYAIEFESSSDARVNVQMYDEIALQAVTDGVNYNESQNATSWTGWAGSMELEYTPVNTSAGYIAKAFRFTFDAKDAGITKCIIYKKKVR